MIKAIASKWKLIAALAGIAVVGGVAAWWYINRGDGPNVVQAKRLYSEYQSHVRDAQANPDSAGEHLDLALSKITQAQNHLQSAQRAGENGLRDVPVDAINRAVTTITEQRSTHFTGLAQQAIDEGDGFIGNHGPQAGQPADPDSARAAYDRARGHAQHVGNNELVSTVDQRLQLRPMQAQAFSAAVGELAQMHRQALGLQSLLSHNDWYVANPNTTVPQNYTVDLGLRSRDGKLADLKRDAQTAAYRIETNINNLTQDPEERRRLKAQLAQIRQTFATDLERAQNSTPDTFWRDTQANEPAVDRASTQLTDGIRGLGAHRVNIPGRQPAAPAGGELVASRRSHRATTLGRSMAPVTEVTLNTNNVILANPDDSSM